MTIDYRKEISPLQPYVPGKPIDDVKREFGLSEVCKLASNENPYGCSPKAVDAVALSMKDPGLYPDGNCTLLREALAKKFDVPGNSIVFGCGTDEVISMIGKVFVEKGDVCLTGEVTFSQYAASVVSMGGEMRYIPMKNHGFDLDAIAKAVTDKTKVIFLANPNNPTGTMFSEREQLAFIEKIPKNVLIVADEAYAEFVADGGYPKTLSQVFSRDNVILLKTFSKAYGLASLRCGYGIMPVEIAALFEKIRNPFNVSSQAQAAALAALADDAFLESSVKGNRSVMAYTVSRLNKMNIPFIPSQSNFLMIDAGSDSMALFHDLMKKGYIIRAGAAFGLPTYLRVTLGTQPQMEGFLDALELLIKR
jgi:histidinol-phosphate aminotransferase